MRASASASMTLRESPLVENAISASPTPPYAITWRVNTACGPMSLAIAVTIAGSELRSSARRAWPVPPGSGRERSATRSMASVAEPPLPSASSVPPRSKTARSATAAASSVSAASLTVCSRRSSISFPFMTTEARTSASTPSRSLSLSLRNG